MKKLLVFLLVLGLATTANAALLGWADSGGTLYNTTAVSPLEIGVGATVTVYLNSDTADLSAVTWSDPGDTSVVKITGGSPLAAAGNSATFDGTDPSGYVGWGRGESKTGDPDLAPITAGNWYEVEITAQGIVGDTATMASDYYGAVGNDDLYVKIIPEPMTVALLGLGGLFLIRRKR